ncbi:hypothetical protein ACUXZJ_07170 [Flavobacterium sp. TN-1]
MTAEEKEIALQILEEQPNIKTVYFTIEGEYFTDKDMALNATKEKDKVEEIKPAKKTSDKATKEDK